MKVHLLHIPKTGGTTVHRALQQAGVNIKRSHDPAMVPPDADLVITLLRDPVARVVSAYRYQTRLDRFEGSLCEFVATAHQPWWWGAQNVQYRMISDAGVDRLTVGFMVTLDSLIGTVCRLAGVPYPTGYEWRNVASNQDFPGLTAHEYEAIAAVNQDDMALYDAQVVRTL